MLQILNPSNWQCYRSGIIFTNQQNILHSSRTQTLQIFVIVRQHAYHAQCNNILLFLSTCPSTTCYCIQTKAHIVINFFDQLVGASYQFSQRNHHQKIPRRTLGWEKFAIFSQNCHLSQKRYEIGPWLLWITKRKSQEAN